MTGQLLEKVSGGVDLILTGQEAVELDEQLQVDIVTLRSFPMLLMSQYMFLNLI